METNKSMSATENFCGKAEKSIEDIKYWTWSEVLGVLKQCKGSCPKACFRGIVDKCLNSLISRVASSCEFSPCPSISSSDSSGIRLSCDTRSTESSKNSSFRTIWWFEDVVALDTGVIRELVKMMVSRNFDNGIISRFLFYYQKTRLASASADQKIKIIETVVEMLDCLDMGSVSYKNLFQLLRVGLKINLSTCCQDKIESMIGCQLDQATLDNLLVPSSVRTSSLYDVNLVLRLVKSFLSRGVCCVPLTRLNKVASLMDLYLAEVAPDPCLKPLKFLALMQALPESARDCYDEVYNAVNLYLEVHLGLSEEQKMEVCLGLNYEKLSSGALNHLAQNTNFHPKSAVRALISQQRKLKNLLHSTNKGTALRGSASNWFDVTDEGRNVEGCKEIVLYAKKLTLSNENEMLKAHLRGMQSRVVELEKVCRKMQIRMSKLMKSRNSSMAKSVPKLCS